MKNAKPDPRLTKLTTLSDALPDTSCESKGDHAIFRVRKKVFAYFLNNHHGDGIVSLCLKSELGENVDRAKSQPEKYYLPAYIGSRGWFGVRLDKGKVNWDEVKSELERSYRLCAPKTLLAKLDAR
jgi:predicted DNA-binding protein (MmcQ/YjbR family)